MVVVAYEIVPGYQQRLIRFTQPATAARLWATCRTTRNASFRILTDTGEEFGTRRPGDIHGMGGIFTERCAECRLEFRTQRVGAPLCPGCELVLQTESWEAW